MLEKIKLQKKDSNENWVSKILNKRKRTPVIFIVSLTTIILLVDFANEYLSYKEHLDKNTRIEQRIADAKEELKKIDRLKKSQEKQINLLEGLVLDGSQPLTIIKRVCDLLKLREVIGSYYVKRAQNKEFANVLNIEIQISYGDKELLFLVMKIVSEQLFYMKNIKQTPKGVLIELYKPKD